MGSFGEFTSEKPADYQNPLEGLFFSIDGERFDCAGEVSLLDMSDLSRIALTNAAMVDVADNASVSQMLLQALSNDCTLSHDHDAKDARCRAGEYDRFRAHCREHKTPDETVTLIIRQLNEAVQQNVERLTGRPTGPQSPSSSGPAETGQQTSRVISLQAGTVRQMTPVRRLPDALTARGETAVVAAPAPGTVTHPGDANPEMVNLELPEGASVSLAALAGKTDAKVEAAAAGG